MSACTASEDRAPAERPDPDHLLLSELLTAQTNLLALVEGVGRRSPRQASALSGTRAIHAAHVRLLTDAVGDDDTQTPMPTPTQTTRPTPMPTPMPSQAPSQTSSPALAPASPRDDRAAFRALARAEDELCHTLRQSALLAHSGQLARLLAGMAAGCAQQAAKLRGPA